MFPMRSDATSADNKSLSRTMHIGMRKTATTWLQKAAEDASRAGKIQYQHWDIARSLAGLKPREVKEPDLEHAFKYLEKLPVGVPALASLENIIAFDPSIAATALSRVWPDAQVLITTRSPQSYLLSSFNNDSFRRSAAAQDFKTTFLRNHMERVFNLDKIVSSYERVFGQGSVTLIPYELLCSDSDEFIRLISRTLGVELSEYCPTFPVNVSPPIEFIALERKVNKIIEDKAPDVLVTEEWIEFKRMANFSAGSAPMLRSYFRDYFRAHPIVDGDIPILTEAEIRDLGKKMELLRNLSNYQNLLDEYGLT